MEATIVRNSPTCANPAPSSDADVVAFIFREEVYKKDDPDLEGIAEVIIAKQRNGPTGLIKLAFKHSSTRFENLAAESDYIQ